MSTETFPVKSLVIKSANFDITPCYVTDFSEGVWNMCISSIICTDVKLQHSSMPKHVAVTCNFVTAEKCLFRDSGPHTYDQPLAVFLMERGHASIEFDRTWFRVNKPSDCLRLKLIDTQAEPMHYDEIRPDGKFTIFVLFQRVK